MIFGSVRACSKFRIQTIHLNSGKFIIIVIEKNIYFGGVIYHTHQIAFLTFMTNQKNIFCEELKAQLLDKSLLPGYLLVCYLCSVILGIWKKEAFLLSVMLLMKKLMTRC